MNGSRCPRAIAYRKPAMDIDLMTAAEKVRYEQLLDECRALIANEKAVDAVRLYRLATGASLKTAMTALGLH